MNDINQLGHNDEVGIISLFLSNFRHTDPDPRGKIFTNPNGKQSFHPRRIRLYLASWDLISSMSLICFSIMSWMVYILSVCTRRWSSSSAGWGPVMLGAGRRQLSRRSELLLLPSCRILHPPGIYTYIQYIYIHIGSQLSKMFFISSKIVSQSINFVFIKCIVNNKTSLW